MTSGNSPSISSSTSPKPTRQKTVVVEEDNEQDNRNDTNNNNMNNNNINVIPHYNHHHQHPYGSSQRLAHSHHRVHHSHHHHTNNNHTNNNNIRKVMSQLSVNNTNNTPNNSNFNSIDEQLSSYSNDINMNGHNNHKIHSAQSFNSLSTYYRDEEHPQQRHVHYFESDEFDRHLYPPPSSSSSSAASSKVSSMVHFNDDNNEDHPHYHHQHHEHEEELDDHHHHTVDIHHHDDHHHYEEEHPIVGKYHPQEVLHSINSNTGLKKAIKSPPLEHDQQQEQHLSEMNHKKSIKQYFQHEYLGFEQNIIKRSDKHRDNEYRSQLELITAIDEHCDSVLHSYTSFRMFILSLMGGIFVSIGTLLSGLISSDITTKSMQKFMIGIAFVGAFTMIIFSKSILFTEVNISVSVHLFKNDLIGIIRRSIYWLISGIFTCFKNHIKIRRPHKSIKLITILNSIKLWSIAIFGNILGTILMSAILSGSYVWYDNQSVIQFLSSTTKHKIDLFQERGASGWFSCLLSGMVANFMIGVATLLCSSGVTIIGKIIALFFPIIAFAALGVQHAPANVGYFSHIFIWDSMYGATTNITITPEINYVMNHIEWYESIYWNLIPAALGNALGAFFLAFVFVFIFVK